MKMDNKIKHTAKATPEVPKWDHFLRLSQSLNSEFGDVVEL